jgi:hypothetical protein
VDRGQLGPLKKLGAAFMKSGAAYSDADLLAADFGPGVKVWQDTANGGRVMLSSNGEVIPLRDAIRHGIVKVSRKRG